MKIATKTKKKKGKNKRQIAHQNGDDDCGFEDD